MFYSFNSAKIGIHKVVIGGKKMKVNEYSNANK